MKERPILFSGSMIRAVLAGTKTQTRRIVRMRRSLSDLDAEDYRIPVVGPSGAWRLKSATIAGASVEIGRCPHGVPGDRLWVRETHAQAGTGRVFYRADDGAAPGDAGRWTPAIHMPRALSRIDLEILAVRVERLHDITEDDIRAEGVQLPIAPNGQPLFQVPNPHVPPRAREGMWTSGDFWRGAFACLWDEINGKRAPWALNPWVWAFDFRRVRP